MKILCISDHHRHELGCAAALKAQGFEVEYFAIGYVPSFPLNSGTKELTVSTNAGDFTIPVTVISQLSLPRTINGILPSICRQFRLEEESFDLIMATPGTPWWVGYHLAMRIQAPLALRLWGFKALKIKSCLSFRDYVGVATLFVPSVIHCTLECALSKAVISIDYNTWSTLQKWMFWNREKTSLAYPNFAILKSENRKGKGSINKLLSNILEDSDYILSICSVSYKNANAAENFLFNTLVRIAKQNPKLVVVIVGTSTLDLQRSSLLNHVPNNLLCLGRIYSDSFLEYLYKKAKLVVAPVFWGTTSNRLIEAFYYGKPILTNTMAKHLFPELKHKKNAYFSDRYDKYGQIVNMLCNSSDLLKELELGSINASQTLFSTRMVGHILKNIIEKKILS